MTVLEKLLFKNSQRIVGPYLSPMFFKFGYFGMNVWNSAVGDWGVNTSTIIIKRDDDGAEEEFLSINKTLDAVGIKEFLEWNLLDGGAYRDFLKYVPLGVDEVGDGSADGWAYSQTPGLVGVEKEVTWRGQKLKFTGSPQQYAQLNLQYLAEGIIENEEIVYRIPYKCTELVGDSVIQNNIKYFNALGDQVGTTSYNTVTNSIGEGVAVITETVPADGVKVEIRVMAISYTVGVSGDGITAIIDNMSVINGGVSIPVPPFNVDTDGVSDGWGGFISANHTATLSVDDSYQKVNIVASSGSDSKTGVSKVISVVAGDVVTVSTIARLVGDYGLRLQIDWQKTGGAYISSTVGTATSPASDTEIILNGTAPELATECKILVIARTTVAGQTGSAYFKDAKLIKNDFIENIGLLTKDGGSGVAEGWDPQNSSDTDITINREVDEEQKIIVTQSLITNVRGGVARTILVQPNTDYTLEHDTKISNVTGDFKSRLIFVGDSSGALSVDDNTNTEYATKTSSFTTDGSDTNVRIYLQGICPTAGSVGTAHFKNVTLKQTNNSADVVKVFDKSGNGNHALQPTASEQPRLVNAGTFEVDGDGNYAMYFDGVDDNLDIIDNNGLNITSQNISILSKFDPDVEGYIITRNTGASNTNQYGVIFQTTFQGEFWIEGSGRVTDGSVALLPKVNIFTYDHATAKGYLNGVLINEESVIIGDLTETDNIQIGCRSNSVDGTSKAFLITGHISRIIVFDKVLTQQQVTYLTSKV